MAHPLDSTHPLSNTEHQNLFVFELSDDVPPWFLDCPADITQYTGDLYGAVVQWAEPRPADNVDIITPVHRSHSSGDYFTEGAHVIQNVVKDTSGNEGLCEFNVTVETGTIFNEALRTLYTYAFVEICTSGIARTCRVKGSRLTNLGVQCILYITQNSQIKGSKLQKMVT